MTARGPADRGATRRHDVLVGLAGGVVAIVLAGIAALLVIERGWFDATATAPHSAAVAWAVHHAFINSVKRDAGREQAPPAFTQDQVDAGFRMYERDCVMCHGGPATARAAWVSGMKPTPPFLLDAARRWTPAQLHWIVGQGVKMTGMPAWSETRSDADIWNVVAFLDALSRMSPATYLDMRAALAATPDTATKEASH